MEEVVNVTLPVELVVLLVLPVIKRAPRTELELYTGAPRTDFW